MGLHYKVPIQDEEEINPDTLLQTLPFQSQRISLWILMEPKAKMAE